MPTWEKDVFFPAQLCRQWGQSQKPTQHLVPTENHQHRQSGDCALHASTLNLVWVKSSRLVSVPGCSSRWLLWPGWAEPAAHSLQHHPSPQVQVISAQLPAAGKHIMPFLQAMKLFPVWPSCHGCLQHFGHTGCLSPAATWDLCAGGINLHSPLAYHAGSWC